MDELLSLKWNNHKTSFLQLLSSLRKMSTYTDVTLACDGQLYNVHKMVLSACSDYFSTIFETISCNNPVIVLKDMSAANLESLLDYMYIGEVSVRQADLTSLIQAAECLKLKGLAVPDTEIGKSAHRKRSPSSSPSMRKKQKRSTTTETPSYPCDTPKDDVLSEPDLQPTTNSSSILKTESAVFIKEESVANTEDYEDDWQLSPYPDDSINLDPNLKPYEDVNQYDTFPNTISSSNTFTESQIHDNITNFDMQPLTASSTNRSINRTLKVVNAVRKSCSYCTKSFACLADLTRHVRVHTGEKPFVCPLCPYRANQKGCLNSHLISKH